MSAILCITIIYILHVLMKIIRVHFRFDSHEAVSDLSSSLHTVEPL